MANSPYIHYDENVDHLTIYHSDEKIASTLDLGFVLLSLDKEKKVVGIEFMGAHKNFKLPLNMLAQIKSCTAELSYNPAKKTLVINTLLHYKEKESPLVYCSDHLDFGENPFTQSFACSVA